MADTKLTGLTANTAPLLTDLLYMVDDPGGTPLSQKITFANALQVLNAPQGFLINGKIVPSVASNNLTVAIKGIDGNDPSASNPVYCRIGDTVRAITSALSVVCNAGTNWFNAGHAKLATQEIDYFVYLGYNATDGIVLGFSRFIGYEYDSFSTTNTNERFCGITIRTNAAAGDDYEVVGRFAATLSAGAGYTWSVPTFTNKNLIQRPIYETRKLVYTPTIVWTAGTAPTGGSNVSYQYQLIGSRCFILGTAYAMTEGATVTSLFVPLPFTHGGLTAITTIAAHIGLGHGANLSHGYIGFASEDLDISCTSCSATAFSFTGDYLIS